VYRGFRLNLGKKKQNIFGSLLTTFDVSCIFDSCLNSNCQIKDLQGRSKAVAREAVA